MSTFEDAIANFSASMGQLTARTQTKTSGGGVHQSQYQKRGKDGKFKSGYTFKPRGAANQSASSVADLGKSAITKPKP